MNNPNWTAQDIILENKRVLLKPLSQEYFEDLLPIATEPELWEIGVTQIRHGEDLKNYIDEALKQRANGSAYPFVIIDKITSHIVGSTRYFDISNSHKRLDIGWTWLSKKTRGSGLNHACKFELLSFAFEKLFMNRVEFRADAINARSRAALKKIGAAEEGILRSHTITYTGRVRDTVIHSMILSEWPNIKQAIFSEY